MEMPHGRRIDPGYRLSCHQVGGLDHMGFRRSKTLWNSVREFGFTRTHSTAARTRSETISGFPVMAKKPQWRGGNFSVMAKIWAFQKRLRSRQSSGRAPDAMIWLYSSDWNDVAICWMM